MIILSQTIVDSGFWASIAIKLIEGFADNPVYLFMIVVIAMLMVGFLKSDKIISEIIKGVQKYNQQKLDLKLKEQEHEQSMQEKRLQQEQKLKEVELEHQRIAQDRKFKRDEDMTHSVKEISTVLEDIKKVLRELVQVIKDQEEIIEKQTEVINHQISIIKTFHERCRVHRLEIEREIGNLDIDEEEKQNILSIINCLPDVSYG